MAAPVKAPWTTPQTLEAVRPQVRELLTSIPAFSHLGAEEQQHLARDMVKVLSYIANPNGVLAAAAAPQPAPMARAQADEDPVEATKRSLSTSPGMVGEKFKAGAVREGVEQFGALVQKVDFPKFVGGLIKNVFQAIVESSIEQMRAYGELIANVAKTVDQFMADNISVGAGRDWLAERYPDTLGVEVNAGSGGLAEGGEAAPTTTQLVARGEDPEQRLQEISRDLGVEPPVTDVSINAKVVFDMRAQDQAKRHYTASMHDQSSQRYRESVNASYGGWFSP